MLNIHAFPNSSGLYIYAICPKKAGCYCKREEIIFLILHPSGYFCQVVTVWGSEKSKKLLLSQIPLACTFMLINT